MVKWMMACVGLIMMTGCVSLEIKAQDCPLRLDMDGLASGHASYSGIRSWDGSLVNIGLLGNSRQNNELASVELWPLIDVGVGVVGVRAKVLAFELGLGMLAYQPKPQDYINHDDDDDDD